MIMEEWEDLEVLDQETTKEIDNKIVNLAEKESSKNVNLDVIISSKKRQIKPLNDFVILFLNSFVSLMVKFDLQKNDMLVLFAILSKMKNGNQVNITQKAIAKELGRDTANLNRNYKKLRECGILISDEYGNEFINTNIIVNKSLRRIREEDAHMYYKSLQESEKRNIDKNY